VSFVKGLVLFVRLFISALFLFYGLVALADEQVKFEPVPAWVQNLQPPLGGHLSSPSNGLRYLLIDRQLNLDAQNVSQYSHYIMQITSTEGLEQASQLSFDFDPEFESLQIHQVRVLRQGESLDRLEPNELRLFQREPDLEHHLYSGTKTAYLILPDIRVGDVLEYSFSTHGINPVLGDKFSAQMQLDWEMPVEFNSVRVLVHSGRTLYYSVPDGKNGKLTMTETSTHRELLWQQSPVSAINADDDIPTWFTPHHYWSLSEFSSWQDVAKWAIPLFEQSAVVEPSIQQIADQFMQQSVDPKIRVMAALEFVQQQIRYLGIEDGIGSHVPRKAADTLYRRYGDCKDKSVLLMALLKAMGFDAKAALVNLEQGSMLTRQLPSPYVFDHVIVTLTLAGQQYWLDGTDLNQGTNIDTIGVPYLHYALVVSPESTDLVSLDNKYRTAEIVIRRELWLDKPQGRLLVETHYSGHEAETQRSAWKNISPSQMSHQFFGYYSKLYPELEDTALSDVQDDLQKNELVLRQQFTLSGRAEELMQSGLPLYADQIDTYLKGIDAARKQPLAIGPPVKIRQEFIFHLPRDVNIADYNQHYENDVFNFSIWVQQLNPRLVRVTYRYQNQLNHVPVRELARYREAVQQAREELALNLTLPPVLPMTARANTGTEEQIK
jgi:transglutaminase-like putative cysteine protease